MCNLAFTPLRRVEYVYQIAILLTLSIAYAIFADLLFSLLQRSQNPALPLLFSSHLATFSLERQKEIQNF